MAKSRIYKDLLVCMNGEEVGRLTPPSATGPIMFVYSDIWLKAENKRAVSLSMPLGGQTYRGGVVENFFDNLLPDNETVRKRIQARFGASGNRCFDLLWHIGRDCVGALQLLPESEALPEIKKIEAEPLTDAQISDTLQNYQTMPLGMSRDNEFRISIAGAQDKTALLWYNNQWCRPTGATPTSHIIKLPIGQTGRMDLSESVENEWLCHLILKEYNLPTADCAITFFDDTKALVVRRFDRRLSMNGTWIIRLPQEDMCQALGFPSALKYEQDGGPGIEKIMHLLLGSEKSTADRYNFIKSQLLFWILAAIDGHAKNFSVFLSPDNRYHLTPMYDVMSAHPLVKLGQIKTSRLKMAMAVDGKNRHYHWERMFHRHWINTARRCFFPVNDLRAILDDLLGNMAAVIDSVKNTIPSGFSAQIADSIFDGMEFSKEYFAAKMTE